MDIPAASAPFVATMRSLDKQFNDSVHLRCECLDTDDQETSCQHLMVGFSRDVVLGVLVVYPCV